MNEGWWQRLQRTRLVRYTNTYPKNRYDKGDSDTLEFEVAVPAVLPIIVAATITGVFAYALTAGSFITPRCFRTQYWPTNRYAIFVVTPVCFPASWWLVWRYAPFARGRGIPQVMASIELESGAAGTCS